MWEPKRTKTSGKVHVGTGTLKQVGELIASQLSSKRCAIITDTNVGPVLGDRLKQSLISASFHPTLITIPPGEKSKSLDRVAAICDEMIAAGLDRHSFVIGLGGGVVGDISGFVAAIYHRGIPHVQIPTTLLAMVDSSIGGKTGVNTAAGKNLVGAVHQPSLIITDVDVLKSLPRREFNQGFAEIIKHAIIADAEMFEMLTTQTNLASDPVALQQLIRRNIEIKTAIVAQDEMDRTGERALLNFGHTVGHAIERAGDFEFLHGEAISLGIVAACSLSMKKAGLPQDQRESVIKLLQRFDLPTRLPGDFSRKKILEVLAFDKKFEDGRVRFVVTPAMGSAYLSDKVTMEDIREAVDAL